MTASIPDSQAFSCTVAEYGRNSKLMLQLQLSADGIKPDNISCSCPEWAEQINRIILRVNLTHLIQALSVLEQYPGSFAEIIVHAGIELPGNKMKAVLGQISMACPGDGCLDMVVKFWFCDSNSFCSEPENYEWCLNDYFWDLLGEPNSYYYAPPLPKLIAALQQTAAQYAYLLL
ncbi:hypothetical protein [Stenoxybacter acetivorans]|uniref:hypothetical protein n=1 Tax=Stenoxybacter acetivorans TaxID=422441 RepID=UPI00056587B6|nr:hypothetical protein [Stenoxybacter acetivorans]